MSHQHELRGMSSRKLSSRLRRKLSSPSPPPQHALTVDLGAEEEAEKFKREWGVTRSEEEAILTEFRNSLFKEGLLRPEHDKFMLRRFLRARNHDVRKAVEMFSNHMQWRKEIGADTIIEDFVFQERDAFVSMYPQGYHKIDKMGRPIYIQHLGQLDVKQLFQISSEERIIKYHVQEYERCARYIMPACSKAAGRHIDQSFAIIDMKGVGLKNVTGDAKRMLAKITSIDQDNYPEMMGRTCIINAPSIFKMLWAVVKPMLNVRTQQKIEVCPRDFLPSLLKWADAENLPEYLGGTSKATLLDDAGPWNDHEILQEIANERLRHTKTGRIMEQESEGDKEDRQPGIRLQSIPAAAGMAASEDGPGPSSVDSTDSKAIGTLSDFVDARPRMSRQGSANSGMSENDEFFDARSEDSGRWSVASFRSSSAMLVDEPDSQEGSPGPRVSQNPMFDAPSSPNVLDADERGGAMPAHIRGLAEAESQAQGLLGGVNQSSGASPSPSQGPNAILGRVRAVEEKTLALARGLARPGLPSPSNVRPLGEGTIIARVEALEETVEVLLRAQEVQLEQALLGQEEAEKEKKCCRCCTIM